MKTNKKYYFLVSGGRDSTAMVLKALDEGMTGMLVYGDTRLNMKQSFDSLKKLESYTGWPLEMYAMREKRNLLWC